jgi:hypothetical protein
MESYETLNEQYNNEKNDILKKNGFLNIVNPPGKNSESTFLGNLIKENPTFTKEKLNVKKNGYEVKKCIPLTNNLCETKKHKETNIISGWLGNETKQYNCTLIFFEKKGCLTIRSIALHGKTEKSSVLMHEPSTTPTFEWEIAAEKKEIRTGRIAATCGLAALTGLGLYWFSKK